MEAAFFVFFSFHFSRFTLHSYPDHTAGYTVRPNRANLPFSLWNPVLQNCSGHIHRDGFYPVSCLYTSYKKHKTLLHIIRIYDIIQLNTASSETEAAIWQRTRTAIMCRQSSSPANMHRSPEKHSSDIAPDPDIKDASQKLF